MIVTTKFRTLESARSGTHVPVFLNLLAWGVFSLHNTDISQRVGHGPLAVCKLISDGVDVTLNNTELCKRKLLLLEFSIEILHIKVKIVAVLICFKSASHLVSL